MSASRYYHCIIRSLKSNILNLRDDTTRQFTTILLHYGSAVAPNTISHHAIDFVCDFIHYKLNSPLVCTQPHDCISGCTWVSLPSPSAVCIQERDNLCHIFFSFGFLVAYDQSCFSLLALRRFFLCHPVLGNVLKITFYITKLLPLKSNLSHYSITLWEK